MKLNSNVNQIPNDFGTLYTTSDMLTGSQNIDSMGDRSAIFTNYSAYFRNIVTSHIKINGLPEDIFEHFIKTVCLNRGFIACVDTGEYGWQFQPAVFTGKYNFYGQPTEIKVVTFGNMDPVFNGRTFTKDKFEILRMTPNMYPLANIINFFVYKIMEVQRAVDVNVFSNQTPLIIEGNTNQTKTVEEVVKSLVHQVKMIFVKKDRGDRAEDMIKSLDATPDFKADKMLEVLEYYEHELLTMCGVNNTPYEKNERLIKAEVNSNNMQLGLTQNSIVGTMNYDFEKINKKSGYYLSAELVFPIENENTANAGGEPSWIKQ